MCTSSPSICAFCNVYEFLPDFEASGLDIETYARYMCPHDDPGIAGEEDTGGWKVVHVFVGRCDVILTLPKACLPNGTKDFESGTNCTVLVAREICWTGGDSIPSPRHALVEDDAIQHWNSQHGQDLHVMRMLRFRRNGFFVDIGAFDAVSRKPNLRRVKSTRV